MSTLWINGIIYLEAFKDHYLYSKSLASFHSAYSPNNQDYIE